MKHVALILTGAASVAALASPPKTQKAEPDGPALFAKNCAACHGARGEGASVYPRPLSGPLSEMGLAGYLEKNMPPGAKHASKVEAQKIAAFMHPAFYSPLAQERLRPARVALSRLTASQYKNALADLIGSLRPAPPPLAAEQGLRGTYFKARFFDGNQKVLERLDFGVRFDFGQSGPTPTGFDPYQFSIRWEGGLVAPDTGEYELIVRTDQAIRLWLNDGREKKALVDAWVKSGKGTYFSAPIYLLGGRTYPIRLEFSKSTFGVDDTKDQNKRPVAPAFVTLAWKRPHRTEEPIPTRFLTPAQPPETFVARTPLPPDDRSMGYARGDSVSKTWDDATTAGAIEALGYLIEHRRALVGNLDEKALARKLTERALRRPLRPEEEQLFVTRQFAKSPDPETGLRRAVLLALKSPGFLYRELDAPDAFARAARLSFALWDAPPDDALLKAAADGKLATEAGLRTEAERLVHDPRAGSRLRTFLLAYLKLDPIPDLAKDPTRFPDFDATMASDLRTSLELFLESTASGESASLKELLLSDKVFLNGSLAPLYGVDLAPYAPFQAISLPERRGVLTQPYVLATFGYRAESDPIHRGVLLTRSFLGRTLAPPPVAVAPVAASLQPNLTTRQRVALQTRPAACNSCHGLINPLGFTLERFDAIGRLRTQDRGQPIDDSGSYEGKPLRGPDELAHFLAESPEVHRAFVEKLFQSLTHQPIRAWGPNALPTLTEKFQKSGLNLRTLMTEIALTAATKN